MMNTRQYFKVMKQYVNLIAEELYDINIRVFFREVHGLRAIFRDKDTPPYALVDIKEWEKEPFISITFHRTIFEHQPSDAWITMVHEVTHFKEGISTTDDWELYHSKTFRAEEEKNLKQVEELRKKFYAEVGLDDMDYQDAYNDKEDQYIEEGVYT